MEDNNEYNKVKYNMTRSGVYNITSNDETKNMHLLSI
jgi:hypothetical protein